MTAGSDVGPKALVKGLQVLNVLAEYPVGLTLRELEEATGIPKPTVHRLVAALADSGLARFDADHGRYRVDRGALTLAGAFLEGVDIRQTCLPSLRGLAKECGETCHLGVRDGVQIVYIDKSEADWPVRMYSRIGATNPMYCTALGKAVLAWSDESVFDAVVEAGMEPRTPATITGREALRDELRVCRERGWVIDDVENELGIRCVAAPVFTWDGEVAAALSVAGPESRMTDEALARFGPIVRDAAREASVQLGWSP
ncbi:IclR family transcriptional regulator [Nocardiopsis nanhaiensis]